LNALQGLGSETFTVTGPGMAGVLSLITNIIIRALRAAVQGTFFLTFSIQKPPFALNRFADRKVSKLVSSHEKCFLKEPFVSLRNFFP